MNDTFSDQAKHSYRSTRGSRDLAQRIDEDYAHRQSGYRFAVPVFASLLVGGLALAVLGPEFAGKDGVEEVVEGRSESLSLPRMEVSQVTAQVGQFARLSMGQIKIPTPSSLVMPVAPAPLPAGMPKPISTENSVRDG